MTILNIYEDKELKKTSSIQKEIQVELKKVGIDYKTWHTKKEFNKDTSKQDIENLFEKEIKQVLKENNFSSYDIMNINSEMEGLETLKEKFIPEHIHDDNEVRFFIDGAGLFCIHHKNRIYQILCTKGDYIAVPAKVKHWFDMGSKPSFKCIRFFENETGWLAKYTGDSISTQYPLYDKFKLINA